jgi:hypothetical protein
VFLLLGFEVGGNLVDLFLKGLDALLLLNELVKVAFELVELDEAAVEFLFGLHQLEGHSLEVAFHFIPDCFELYDFQFLFLLCGFVSALYLDFLLLELLGLQLPFLSPPLLKLLLLLP